MDAGSTFAGFLLGLFVSGGFLFYFQMKKRLIIEWVKKEPSPKK